MTNSKSTKRALLSSAFAILICVAMLIGTTFAWFTDTASTAVNKIQAGNLDIEAWYRTSAEGDWIEIDSATDLFGNESALYEPGYTRVVELKIKNAGNLALKYKIGMNIVSETAGVNMDGNPYKLSNYLKVATTGIQPCSTGDDFTDIVAAALEGAIFRRGNGSMWTARDFANFSLEKAKNGVVNNLMPGKEAILGMKIYMPETVGNDANAISSEKTASINFGIDISATQYNVERDSIDSNYDKDATYPTVAISSDELITAIKNGGTITVSNDMTLDGDGNPDIEVQLKDAGTVDLALNGTVKSGDISEYTWGLMRVMSGTKLVISANENGKFINTKSYSNINVCGGEVVVNGGYFESSRACFFVYTDSDEAVSAGSASLTINGGTFKANRNIIDNALPGKSTIDINGGTFYNWDPSDYVDDNHNVTTSVNDGQVVYTVAAK